jgi:hypothetical protein
VSIKQNKLKVYFSPFPFFLFTAAVWLNGSLHEKWILMKKKRLFALEIQWNRLTKVYLSPRMNVWCYGISTFWNEQKRMLHKIRAINLNMESLKISWFEFVTTRTKDNSDQDISDQDNSDQFFNTTRTTSWRQLGPLFEDNSDQYLG